jgi:hypothetical protein
MYRNRIVLAILAALALIGLAAIPVIQAAWSEQEAPARRSRPAARVGL